MAETNAALASLAARPEATQNMVSVADMMRQRQMLPYQQQQMAAQTAGLQAQVPIQEQTARQLDLENQQRQIALQDQQRQMEYWAHPEKYEADQVPEAATQPSVAEGMAGTTQPGAPASKVNFAEQMLGLSPDDPLAKQSNGMIRAGVTPNTVAANAQGLLKIRADVLKQSADKQELTRKNLDDLNKVLAPIASEQDLKKRTAMLQDAEPMLQKLSEFDPSLHQAIMQADPMHIDKISNLTGGLQASLEYGTKQLQQTEEKQKTAVPDDNDKKLATQTIATYEALPPAMRQGFIAEINNAPTIASMEKIQARADEAYKSEQIKQASLAQAKVMVGNKFGEAGLTANEKIWTDPQHGFAGVLAQAKQTENAIVAGADGNGLVTSMIPTMEVLGINHAAGISRISPQEAQAAGMPGSWSERWNAWADKAMKGKVSPELAKEGNALMDMVLDAAHSKAVSSSALIAKGHGIDPSQTPAMDLDGNLTTLDKVQGKLESKQSGPPQGATHTVKGPDGKMHYTNDQGTVDYGVVP